MVLTIGQMKKDPRLLAEVDPCDVLVAADVETVVQATRDLGSSTMVFEHETIKMMRAERTERIEKLRAAIEDAALIVPLRKKAESFWDKITLGRAATADVTVADPAVSNVHAHFERDDEDGRVSVQDVGSSNGTFVNRVQLQPHMAARLTSGDVVRFGQSIFYYLSFATLKQVVTGQE